LRREVDICSNTCQATLNTAHSNKTYLLFADGMRRQSATLFIIFTVMLDAMGIGLIVPVMPNLIREVSALNMADAAFVGGLLTFSFAAMQFLFGPLLGNLSDAYGRRPVLIVSLVCMGLDYFLMAWAPVLSLLFVARIISGITGATYSTAAAFLSDTSEKGQRSAHFGLMGGAFGIGLVLGPALGGLIAEFGTRMPFVVAGILALSNAAFGFLVLPETLSKAQRRPFQLQRCNPFGALLRIRRFPAIAGLMLTTFLLATANNVYAVIWPFFTIEKFAWSVSTVGWSFAAYGLSAAIVQAVILKWLINRFGARTTILFGFVMGVFTLIWIAFINSTLWIFLGIPVTALSALVGPAIQGLMADEVEDSEQGELQGIFASVIALSMIVSPLLMGTTFKLFTHEDAIYYFPGSPFIVAAVLMVISMLLFIKQSGVENQTELKTSDN